MYLTMKISEFDKHLATSQFQFYALVLMIKACWANCTMSPYSITSADEKPTAHQTLFMILQNI